MIHTIYCCKFYVDTAELYEYTEEFDDFDDPGIRELLIDNHFYETVQHYDRLAQLYDEADEDGETEVQPEHYCSKSLVSPSIARDLIIGEFLRMRNQLTEFIDTLLEGEECGKG